MAGAHAEDHQGRATSTSRGSVPSSVQPPPVRVHAASVPCSTSRRDGGDEPLDALEGAAEADARADGRGRAFAPRVLEELVDEQVGAELAVAHADAVLGGEDPPASAGVASPSTVKRDARRRGRCRRQDREELTPATVVEPGAQPVEQARLVRLDAPRGARAMRRAGRGEGDGAEDVGAAALVARRAGRPRRPSSVTDAASRRRRRGRAAGVEPVAAPGEHARAVGGVDLWPEKRDVVDVPARRGRSARCGASWAASTATRAPCAVRDRGDPRRSASTSPVTLEAPGDDDEAVARRRGAQRGLEQSCQRLLDGRGTAGGARCGRARHGSRFAWCSTSKTTAPSCRLGSAPASRFSASVVLRVKTTTSSSRAPDEPATHLAGPLVRTRCSPARRSPRRGAR